MVKQAIEDAEENAKLNGMHMLTNNLSTSTRASGISTSPLSPSELPSSPHSTSSPLPLPPPDISNVQYVCGKAEEVMSNIELPWVRLGGIVGIVDPPRGGLRKLNVTYASTL